MPSHGDPADAKERRDRRGIEFLDFVHYDDCSLSRRKAVECPPHGRMDDERCLRIGGLQAGGRGAAGVTPANAFFSPLVASHVHQDANQPRLFSLQAMRDGFGRARRLEERLLNEIERIVCVRGESASQAVDPVFMGVEQRRQPGGVLWLHISLNVQWGRNVWVLSEEVVAASIRLGGQAGSIHWRRCDASDG